MPERAMLSRGLIANLDEVGGIQDALQNAIKLEHATLPPYLYAAFSIKPGAGNDASARLVKGIASEEMAHMALACNILNAIGGAPQINTPGFVPTYPGPLPGGVDGSLVVGLEPFSPSVVEKTFMVIEHPDVPLEFRTTTFAAEETLEITIGDFYRAILAALKQLPASAFIKDHSRQVDGFFAELTPVVDFASAAAAIEVIVEQGEGTTTSPVDPESNTPAHYYRFQEIVKGRTLITNPNPPPDPKPDDLFVFGGPQVPFVASGVFDIVSNPDPTKYSQAAKQADDIFNTTYTSLLKQLHDAFNGHPDNVGDAINTMFELPDQATTLMEIPAGDGSGKNAGPSFRLLPV